MTDDSADPAGTLLCAYAAAVAARDAQAFAALYAPDALVFDLWGRFTARGRDAQRAMARDWFGSLGDEQVRVSWHDLQQQTAPGLVCAQALMSFAAVAPDGQVLRSMTNRLSWVLVPAAAGDTPGPAWRVLHEHSSVPLNPADATPIFAPPAG